MLTKIPMEASLCKAGEKRVLYETTTVVAAQRVDGWMVAPSREIYRSTAGVKFQSARYNATDLEL